MLLAAACCGNASRQPALEVSLMRFMIQENYDYGEDSFSSKTITRSIERKLHRNGWQRGECSEVVDSKPKPSSSREFGAGFERAVHTQSPCCLTEFEQFCKRESSNIAVSRYANLSETCPHGLNAETVAISSILNGRGWILTQSLVSLVLEIHFYFDIKMLNSCKKKKKALNSMIPYLKAIHGENIEGGEYFSYFS